MSASNDSSRYHAQNLIDENQVQSSQYGPLHSPTQNGPAQNSTTRNSTGSNQGPKHRGPQRRGPLSQAPSGGRHARRPSREGVNTSRRVKAGLTTLAATGAFLGTTVVTAGSADAGTLTLGQKALRIAESKHGDPYRWGATGPNAFDCSGLTYYAYSHAGHRLPRTAESQYNHVHHISRNQLRPGDLVFFHYGSYVYHVGIYAGNWSIWHSPHSGSYVKLEHIWTSQVWFGRVS